MTRTGGIMLWRVDAILLQIGGLEAVLRADKENMARLRREQPSGLLIEVCELGRKIPRTGEWLVKVIEKFDASYLLPSLRL